MTVMRIRVDFAVVIRGEVLRVSSNLRDQFEFKKLVPSPKGDGEDMIKLAWCGFKRTAQFDGDLEAFIDAVEDFEVIEGEDLPPLEVAPSQS